jgi:hypothetical protein
MTATATSTDTSFCDQRAVTFPRGLVTERKARRSVTSGPSHFTEGWSQNGGIDG